MDSSARLFALLPVAAAFFGAGFVWGFRLATNEVIRIMNKETRARK